MRVQYLGYRFDEDEFRHDLESLGERALMRLGNLAVELVSRVPARVQIQLLVAFLAMVALLILLGAVGLRVLSGMNERNEELIELQRKIAAYRQVQHDTTRQLYGVAAVLLSPDERALDSTLRQLKPVRLRPRPTATRGRGRGRSAGEVRDNYDRFIAIVTGAVERARAGDIAAAREVQLSEARPLADRLERLTNQLVNVAEADMLERGSGRAGRPIVPRRWSWSPSRSAALSWRSGSAISFRGRSSGRSPRSPRGLRQVAAGEFERARRGRQPRRAGRARGQPEPDLGRARSPVRPAPAFGEGAGDARRGQSGDQLDPGAAGRARGLSPPTR